jgi:protein ImuB
MPSSPRIACLLVPDLPLQAELRAHPELRGEPLVIVSGRDPRADVVAVSQSARAEGIHRGASLAQARSILPTLWVRVASPALERAARDTLLDIALSLSPRAALGPRSAGFFAAEGCVFLDARGVGSLFHSEAGFASALAERARRQNLPGAVSLASTRSVALLVARSFADRPDVPCVLSPAQERAFLDPLSLDLLDPDDRVAQALTRFGVRTVRDLLRLPRRALAQRLGPEILELIERAGGTATESPLPEPAPTRIEEALDLEAPIDCLEPLGFVMRGLVSRITERLSLRGLACGALEIGLKTEDGGHDVRRVGLSAPTLDGRVLLRLIALALERHPPAAPVESVSLQTESVPTRTDQLDLFAPRGPDPAALDRTLSELESLCGEGRVGAPEVPDTHHPAAFAQKPFSPPASGISRQSRRRSDLAHEAGRSAVALDPDPTPPIPALRAIRPPVRAEVRIDRGLPAFVRSAVSQGDVIVVSGPWRTTGKWWSPDERFVLDHFDAQISDGCVIRLRFDWMKRLWQVDGIYD